jgi:pimeloyl-ACP methyl ester carboxylesterase
MDTIEVNGLSIAYQRAGSGPPLVLLHGILGDSRDWRPQLEDLSDGFDVIAWDAPGCGQSSDPPENGFGSADFAGCLAGLLRALDAVPAHIAGLSWGGGLALEVFDRNPGVVRSLVLADTYAGWRGSLPAEVVEDRLASCLKESEMAPEEFVPGWIPGLIADTAPQALRDEIIAIMSEFHPAGYRAMAIAFADIDLRHVLPGITVPTLLIWGEDDRRSPVSVGRQMCRSIPGARLVVIPGSGHMSNLERPERFNAEVRAFLSGASIKE